MSYTTIEQVLTGIATTYCDNKHCRELLSVGRMKNGGRLLREDCCSVSGKGIVDGKGCGGNDVLVIRQQHFKFFFGAVSQGSVFLALFIGQLLAEETFTVTGRIGIAAVLTKRGGNGALV